MAWFALIARAGLFSAASLCVFLIAACGLDAPCCSRLLSLRILLRFLPLFSVLYKCAASGLDTHAAPVQMSHIRCIRCFYFCKQMHPLRAIPFIVFGVNGLFSSSPCSSLLITAQDGHREGRLQLRYLSDDGEWSGQSW